MRSKEFAGNMVPVFTGDEMGLGIIRGLFDDDLCLGTVSQIVCEDGNEIGLGIITGLLDDREHCFGSESVLREDEFGLDLRTGLFEEDECDLGTKTDTREDDELGLGI